MVDNHRYTTPDKGETDWHLPLNENFNRLDTDIEVRDVEAELDRYEPKPGAKFFATDTGQVYTGDGEEWTRLSTTGASPSLDAPTVSKINSTACVGSEAELDSALGSETLIQLVDDVTDSGGFFGSYSGEDVVLDLNGQTIGRADELPRNLLTIENPGGSVRIVNGRIDGNRRGQNFPDRKGYNELTVSSAAHAYVSDVAVVDNQGFSINVVACDEVLISDCTVDTRPAGLGSDGAGLDGIHLYDPRSANVSGCSITSGDDAIAVTARDRRVTSVSVKGGTLSSPEHANGVKLHVHGSAGAGVGFETVTIESTVHDVDGNGIIAVNDSSNGEGVTNGRIGGTVTNAGVNGIDLSVPFENVVVESAIRNASNHGINAMSGGRNLHVQGVVQDVGNYGIYLAAVESCSIDAAIDGRGNMARGIRLEDCTDVSISGTIKRTTQGPNTNGIEGQTCRDVVVSGANISHVARPIVSYDSSNYWTVTGCHGHSNNDTDPSLGGQGNVVSANNFR